jgi:hypothetical protein
MLAKVNYRIHTDAIQENLIPKAVNQRQIQNIYASEADLLNVAMFGMTAVFRPDRGRLLVARGGSLGYSANPHPFFRPPRRADNDLTHRLRMM